ncbi:MAG: helix-turn-helix domain-containing protein [Candidatus Dormibacteraeota bacterium]|nr:helix-turn-helix domain-containing protein [Candidatus Dormibacteraeota bacterium]
MTETLGDRVRKVRMERGMSLAKVAGADFSRAFLNQVELNKSRPSVRVLRVIADRLGTPVDYLLDGSTPSLDREIVLEKARLELARGDCKGCLTVIEPALDAREWPLGVDARLCAGEAMLKLGGAEEAGRLLEEQRAEIKAHGDAYRLQRLDAILARQDHRLDAAGYAALGVAMLRDGNGAAALEHFRTARILLEG